jgi:hypothetical protein
MAHDPTQETARHSPTKPHEPQGRAWHAQLSVSLRTWWNTRRIQRRMPLSHASEHAWSDGPEVAEAGNAKPDTRDQPSRRRRDWYRTEHEGEPTRRARQFTPSRRNPSGTTVLADGPWAQTPLRPGRMAVDLSCRPQWTRTACLRPIARLSSTQSPGAQGHREHVLGTRPHTASPARPGWPCVALLDPASRVAPWDMTRQL